MSKSVNIESLSEKVYQHLRTKLGGRQFHVGDPINARHIAAELGVSRSTAYKALHRLVADNLVATDAADHLSPGSDRVVVAAPPPELKAFELPHFEFSDQTESTYELLREWIERGDFGPSETIKERPLATQIGVHPATVRRAAEWLCRDGLLKRLPRRGWRVTTFSTRDLNDAYRIRLILEPLAVSCATARLTSQVLNELIEQTERLIAAGERATVYERRGADHQFHAAILSASGNRTLLDILSPLIRRVLQNTTASSHSGRWKHSFAQHRKILEALCARNELEAAKRMKNHLRSAMRFDANRW